MEERITYKEYIESLGVEYFLDPETDMITVDTELLVPYFEELAELFPQYFTPDYPEIPNSVNKC